MLSKTAEYALRVVVFLVGESSRMPTRAEIATSTRVPLAYLTKVLRSLEHAGIVKPKRGPGGGFLLSRDKQSLTVYDVIAAVAELPRIKACPLGISTHKELCPLHARLDAVAKLTEDAYRQTLVLDLLPYRQNQRPGNGCSFPTAAP
ncbi:MAG: Rrf2 family transcriptional regulator [Planctomycetales bacterium]|nr:Rrf2 family transcriptional regulator [Planctomycetales bacterium]